IDELFDWQAGGGIHHLAGLDRRITRLDRGNALHGLARRRVDGNDLTGGRIDHGLHWLAGSTIDILHLRLTGGWVDNGLAGLGLDQLLRNDLTGIGAARDGYG